MLRQMSETEIQAIFDFLKETEDSATGIDAPLLHAYIKHQQKMLEILDKFKTNNYKEK